MCKEMIFLVESGLKTLIKPLAMNYSTFHSKLTTFFIFFLNFKIIWLCYTDVTVMKSHVVGIQDRFLMLETHRKVSRFLDMGTFPSRLLAPSSGGK